MCVMSASSSSSVVHVRGAGDGASALSASSVHHRHCMRRSPPRNVVSSTSERSTRRARGSTGTRNARRCQMYIAHTKEVVIDEKLQQVRNVRLENRELALTNGAIAQQCGNTIQRARIIQKNLEKHSFARVKAVKFTPHEQRRSCERFEAARAIDPVDRDEHRLDHTLY
jgi:hypothetical protein